jgi:hypothetical protein
LHKEKHTNKTTRGAKESLLKLLRSCILKGVNLFKLIA